MYAYHDGESWSFETVDDTSYMMFSSFVLASNGDKHVTYYDKTQGELKYAYDVGEGWEYEVIDSDGDVFTDEPQQYTPYAADINPDQVVALRFALLVNSGSPIRSRDVSDSFILLDEKYDRNDQWAREVFSSTVKLRNRR